MDEMSQQQEQQPQHQQAPQQQKPTGLAVASLVLAILGWVSCGVAAVPAVICGHMAMGAIKRGEADGKGMATAGLILGYITIGIMVLLILFFAVFYRIGSNRRYC